MPLGIKLGSKNEIIRIFGSEDIYNSFGVYELPSTLLDKEAFSVLKAAGKGDVRFILHAPHPFNSNVDIASANNKVRKEAVDSIKSAIDIASELPAEAVVTHCGLTNPYYGAKTPKNTTPKRNKEDALQTAKMSLVELGVYSKNAGVCLTIENDAALPGIEADSDERRFNFGTVGTTADSIVYLLNGLANLGFTFDIGHSYATANYFKKDPYEFMKTIIDAVGINRIKNVHMTDIVGSIDYHVAVGEGTIDFSKVFPLLEGYNGPMIIENFPADIYKSAERIAHLYNSFFDRQYAFNPINAKNLCARMGWSTYNE